MAVKPPRLPENVQPVIIQKVVASPEKSLTLKDLAGEAPGAGFLLATTPEGFGWVPYPEIPTMPEIPKIPQDLRKESAPEFRNINTTGNLPNCFASGVQIGDTNLSPSEAPFTLRVHQGMLEFSNGEFWLPVNGNITGKGKQNHLAFFYAENHLAFHAGLMITPHGLHIGPSIEAKAPLTVGSVDGKSIVVGGSIRIGKFEIREATKSLEMNVAGTWLPIGLGEGNLNGKGDDGTLALWYNGEIISAPISYREKTLSVGGSVKVSENLSVGGDLSFGETAFRATQDGAFVGKKKLAFEKELQTLQLGEGFIGPKSLLVEGISGEGRNLSLTQASHTERGIAQFSLDFMIEKGVVSINYGRLRTAGHNRDGILDADTWKYFAGKQDKIHSGAIKGEHIEVVGIGQAVHGGLFLKPHIASTKQLGIASFAEEHFKVANGHVYLNFDCFGLANDQKSGILSAQDFKKFTDKQNALQIGDLKGDGIIKVRGGDGAVIGGGVEISIPSASHVRKGVASFSRDFMITEEGMVCLNLDSPETPLASQKQNGLLRASDFLKFSEKQDKIENPVSGLGKAGFLTIWNEAGKIESAPVFVKNREIYFPTTTHFDAGGVSASFAGAIQLGAGEDLTPERAGLMRFSRGRLEVSTGKIWMAAGSGLGGHGTPGRVSMFDSVETLTDSPIFVNPENGHIGLWCQPNESALSLHRAAGSASILEILNLSASGPQGGAGIFLGIDDNTNPAKLDRLAVLSAGGKSDGFLTVGGGFSFNAAENWSRRGTGTSLSLALTPIGKTTPIDLFHWNGNGFFGIDCANPLAPLHIGNRAPSGNSIVALGSARIGENEFSAAIAGAGSLKYNGGRIAVSNALTWQEIALRSEIEALQRRLDTLESKVPFGETQTY